jgi:flavodoxin
MRRKTPEDPMKALVVYDSFFGNTELVADTIGAVFGECAEVTLRRVGEVQPADLEGIGFLCVGSPTRAFRPSPAIQTWLKRLPKDSLRGVQVAAFDTRIAVEDVDSRVLPVLVRVFGYAAEPIAAALVRKGGTQVLPPAGFCVIDTEGPLKDGELQRARAWAAQLAVPA